MPGVVACSRALFFLSCFVLLAGCGDDGSGSDGGSSGTSGGDGDAGDGDGDGDGDSCDIPPLEVTEAGERILSNLSVSGDKLVFVSGDPMSLLSTIEVIGADGEGRQTLHTPEGQRRVRSAMAHEDVVYFLEENEEIVSTYELFSIPIDGGAATRIGDSGVPSGYIFGIDDTHVYAVHQAVFERIAIDGGAATRIGSLDGAGTPSNVRLSGDDIFFSAGTNGGQMRGVYQLDKTASDAQATQLWAIGDDDPCYIILGGLFATPTKLVCGYFSLATRGRDGMDEAILFDGMVLDGPKIPFATDGEVFYYGGYQGGTSPLSRMTSAGEDQEVIACDTGNISNKLIDASFAIANAYEVVVGDTEVYWIELSAPDETPPTYKIRRAAK